MGNRQPVTPVESKALSEPNQKAIQSARPIIRRRSSGELPEIPTTPPVEDNLIRFPYSPGSGNPEEAGSAAEAPLPEWRQRVREKVRESREKRGGETGEGRQVPDEVVTDPNPIVESALKRIKRVTPSITPLPVSSRATASVAKALEVEIEEESATTTPREKRPAERQIPAGRVEAPPAARTVAPPPPPAAPSLPVVKRGERPFTRRAEAPPAQLQSPLPTPLRERRVEAVKMVDEVETIVAIEPPVAATMDQIEQFDPIDPIVLGAPGAPLAATTEPATRLASTPEIFFGDLDESDETPLTVSVPPPQPPPAGAEAKKPEAPEARPRQTEEKPETRGSEPAPVRVTRQMKPQPKPPTQIIDVAAALPSSGERSGMPASFWTRTLAGGCDFELIAMSFLPIFAAYAVLNTILNSETFFLMLLLLTALSFVYQAITLVMAGRTYGMAMLNLRLVSLDDEAPEKVSRQQLLMRAWAATIAFLLPPVNLLVRQMNERRLSLPDLVSNTIPVEA